MLGVPRGVHDLQGASPAQRQAVPLVEDEESGRVERLHGAPVVSHLLLAVDARRRRQQVCGVGQVGCAGGVDARLPAPRESGGEVPGSAGVVQVDVGDGQGAHIVDAQVVEGVEEVV